MLIKGVHGLYTRTRSTVLGRVFSPWGSHLVLYTWILCRSYKWAAASLEIGVKNNDCSSTFLNFCCEDIMSVSCQC